MSDEERAFAYRAQAVRRTAFQALLTALLMAPEVNAVRVREAWAPLLERTKRGERDEREEVRPVGVANG